MPQHVMLLDTTPTCMWYRHQQRIIITSTGYKYPTTINAWTYDTIMHMFNNNSPTSTHHLSYMHSPTITPSINIYAIIIIHNIFTTRQFHVISHNSSRGENTPCYDIIILNTQQFIHTSSYNHINLYTKDLQSIRS